MDQIKPIVTKIAERTWCLNEYNLVNAFLIEGDSMAVLIDSGCGIADFSKVVENLTALPITVILTHGHPDHAGGLYYFPETKAYMGQEDLAVEKMMACDNRFRKYYIENRVDFRFPGEGHKEALLSMLPPDPASVPLSRTLPLTEDMTFDLGGRVLDVLHTPGHSDGSYCIFDDYSRILFSGDTVNHSIILMRQKDDSLVLVEQYHTTLEKIWKQQDRFDRLAIGHDGITVNKQIVKDYLDLTEGLLDGSIVGEYEEKGFRKGDVARLGLAELWYRCDA